ncbi:substrate import-associated zinc metallohydrolase lipoprotein [Tenacibaculum agarivorans]|uniref:substrate import-associated zinc metallohydrolase lipoprotein n=1 Tax=Tenacibaculum agarivorans TaxID=1908389 RepID=UPI00094B9283|nr:substrate import-associated zinc metallohydrolase lipoprotein [Tenacibaculum agarivorans]
MKNIYIYLISALSIFTSCDYQEDPITDSNLDTTTPELSTTDVWLRDNYAIPYNIDVTYQWDEGRVDLNRFLFPPFLDNVVPAMNAVKTIWIDSYNQVGGVDFVRKVAPRELVLVGGFNLNEDGTRTLGFAEGGKNIVLFEVDLIDFSNRASVIEFVKTVQHEYTHILNQTIRFDEEAFQQITPADYTAQWFNPADTQERFDIANSLGFITDYARLNHTEDFAEMVETLLSNTATEYAAILDNIKTRIIQNAVSQAITNLGPGATAEDIAIATNAATVTAQPEADRAVNLIRQKEAIVADYYARQLNIDIYELQKVVAENVDKVIN